MPDKRKLTVRERRWLDCYIETGNATDAAEKAGYSATSRAGLSEAGYRLKCRLAPDMDELMERMGLGDGALLAALRDGLNATRVELAQMEGTFTDERVYTDYATRARYLDMAFKLHGLYERKEADRAAGALDLLRAVLMQPGSDQAVIEAGNDE